MNLVRIPVIRGAGWLESLRRSLSSTGVGSAAASMAICREFLPTT